MSHPERCVLILALALMAMHESSVESTITAQGTVSIVSSIPDAFLTIHCQSSSGKGGSTLGLSPGQIKFLVPPLSSGKDLGTKSIPFNGKFTWNIEIDGVLYDVKVSEICSFSNPDTVEASDPLDLVKTGVSKASVDMAMEANSRGYKEEDVVRVWDPRGEPTRKMGAVVGCDSLAGKDGLGGSKHDNVAMHLMPVTASPIAESENFESRVEDSVEFGEGQEDILGQSAQSKVLVQKEHLAQVGFLNLEGGDGLSGPVVDKRGLGSILCETMSISQINGMGGELGALIMATHQPLRVESLVLITGQVRVSNGFASPLLLHCSSDTVDLGNQTVRGGTLFEWTVRVVVGKSNVYSCDLLSGNKRGHFVLFDPKKELSDEVCGTRNFECDWKLAYGGLSLFYRKRREYVLQYPF
ncbi:hypothetical protein RHMOL_Rhmol02G0057700 [Rhododendron molle]|uniref:Uncharacterized protein n=1 Tax=Rhododendron molle TaxID=49168 RepID=A0ACC0PLT4_RHOML|nr:hypothetical protein RHMOL_Rhmol02G0057700 [Rhododendron molle]